MTEKKDNSGTLSTNKNKEKDTHPDKKGKALINGVKYWVSAWEKEGEYGPFLSLSFTKVEKKEQEQPF